MEVLRTANPRANYHALKADIDAAIQRVLDGPAYILGPVVEGFERSFAAYVGAGHGIGVNSGTDALHLALRGLGIGHGDEVITVSHTAVATVAAIEMSGATPVLVDVEPQWRTIDPAGVAAAIGPRTRAVIAVHLYGQPADLDALGALCARHGLALVEDCAQAHGAGWGNAMAGSRGRVAAFSFYPTKNLGAVGDGGMVVTSDAALADKVRQLRQYGWASSGESMVPGWNSRLDPLQAAVLQAKLEHLDAWTERRRALAARYAAGLAGLPLRLPVQRPGSRHAYHLYVVETADARSRDGLLTFLKGRDILPGIHYPVGVHAQPAYAGRIRSAAMPVTEALSGTVLSLPLYPELADASQDRVIAAIRDFYRSAP
jgi:dTDP-4-amino-4,6-dideoxygalactose transaminase